jgi:hypothetical protein
MNLKKLGAALLVVFALGAVMASSALAASEAVTKDVKWHIKQAGVDEVVKATSATAGLTIGAEATTTENFLETTVAGTPLKLRAKKASCIGCKIWNEGGTTAVGSGEIEFTEVTAVTPPLCKVKEEKVRTKALNVKADYMEKVEGVETSTNYIQFKPVGVTFATVTLKECSLAGNYNVEGTVYAKTVNNTGVFAPDQEVEFSGAINATAKGELKFGEEPATLEGKAKFWLPAQTNAAQGKTLVATTEFKTE